MEEKPITTQVFERMAERHYDALMHCVSDDCGYLTKVNDAICAGISVCIGHDLGKRMNNNGSLRKGEELSDKLKIIDAIERAEQNSIEPTELSQMMLRSLKEDVFMSYDEWNQRISQYSDIIEQSGAITNPLLHDDFLECHDGILPFLCQNHMIADRAVDYVLEVTKGNQNTPEKVLDNAVRNASLYTFTTKKRFNEHFFETQEDMDEFFKTAAALSRDAGEDGILVSNIYKYLSLLMCVPQRHRQKFIDKLADFYY